MKISSNNPRKDTDINFIIADLQEKYGEVYWNLVDGEIFIHRALGRLEYKELVSSDASQIEKEDAVCKTCILYPENIDLDEFPAGIPSKLFKYIMSNSFLDSLDSKLKVVNYYRKEMEEFDNQITCIINEAFPNHDIEEIENWDMQKTAKYLSRAEWKLGALRNIPVDYDTSNEMIASEWNEQVSKIKNTDDDLLSEEAVGNTIEEEQVEVAVKEDKGGNHLEHKKETLEERQARLKNNNPKKYNSEEIARFKKMFPDLQWDNEINPAEDPNSMKDSVDVLAPALRPGW